MLNTRIISIMCSVLVVTACTQTSSKRVETSITPHFSVPQVPTFCTTPEQRAEFVVTHYWNNFDFADTSLISLDEYTEQAFADFVNLLVNVPVELAQRGVDTLMNRAEADSSMYALFRQMSDKYLYDPNSPLRSEELYILVLKNIVANNRLSEIEKIGPQYRLNLALKNRIGHKATDFEYTLENGRKARLYSVKGAPLLLFFFRPDCPTCKEVKEYVFNNKIDDLLKIIWVNPDIDTHIETIYDVRASPTLYLLDENKMVLLKDAPIKQIEDYIKAEKK